MQRRTSIPTASTALVLLLALLAGGCAQPMSPEEEVAELRSKYSAELNGFVVQQQPMEPAEDAAEGEEGVEEDQTPGEAEEGEAGAEADEIPAEPVPTTQDVILDILVSTSSRDTLSGLTVDVTQVDGQGELKETWRVYLDTSAVHRGPGTQISHTLADVSYEEGDGFNVEVRHPVPPEDRGDYREFQEPGFEG